MSKKEILCQRFANIIGDLISSLEEADMIKTEDVFKKMGFQTKEIVVTEVLKTRRRNYEEIAEKLKSCSIFMEVDRRAVWYIKSRLNELTGKEIVSYPATFGYKKGYIFLIPPDDEQV